MRIKYIVPFAWGPEGVAKRDALVPRESLSAGTEVDTVPVRSHPAPGGSLVSYYESALMDVYMIDAAVGAQDEGYDAVVMDTTSDSGIYAIRSRLSIPVVGPSMVSYAVATLLGLRFAIVCYSEAHRRFYETKLEFYKMGDRCVSIRAAGVIPNYESLFGTGSDAEFDRLTETASDAIEHDGAEVIVLGSTTMAQAQPYMAARLMAPVISPGPVAIKLAESLVTLGLSHSKLAFPSPQTVEDEVWARLAAE
jgi:allantoin racemase